MRRALVVQPDGAIRAGLRRSLHAARSRWEVGFVADGSQALARLADRPHAAVVTDLDGPGLDGPDLLGQVRARHPTVARLVLTGRPPAAGLGAVGPAHQLLSMPCDREELLAALDRACSTQDLLRKDRLRRIVAGLESLPSQSPVLNELLAELAGSACSVRKVGRLVAADVGLASRVLQVANSAFFGGHKEVADPTRAVMALGLDVVGSLALAQRAFSGFAARAGRVLSLEALWRHSSDVGACARFLAGRAGLPEPGAGHAFTAGLLHDLGKLILATWRPQDVLRVRERAEQTGTPEWRLEQDHVGASHAELGGRLASLWGLPEPVVEGLTWHHAPWRAPKHRPGVLTLVAIADRLVRQRSIRPDSRFGRYLGELGVARHLPGWTEAWEERSAVRVLR